MMMSAHGGYKTNRNMIAGIHDFFSESSARQVRLMVYFPGYNLGCPDKSAEFYKKNGEKNCVQLEHF